MGHKHPVRSLSLPSLRPGPAVAALVALAPATLLCLIIAIAAQLGSERTPAPAMLVALVLGVCASPLAARPAFAPGIDFSARTLLRIGVALLGVRITFGDIFALGWGAVVGIAGLIVTLVAGVWIARLLKLPSPLAWVSAGAVAICGASAGFAVSAAVEADREYESEVASIIAGITVLGSIGMLLFPALAALLHLDPHRTAVFLGGSLHEVAHVVGAGAAVSPAVEVAATSIKLVRVACLAPVVALIALARRRPEAIQGGRRPAILPWFLAAFLVLAALASFRLIPRPMSVEVADVSRYLLLVAMAALGMKSSPQKLLRAGPRLLGALVAQSLLIAAFVLGAVLVIPAA